MTSTKDRQCPLAYHITFNCYGRWLHGDPAGSVDGHRHNYPGSPTVPASRELWGFELEEMKQPPYELDGPRRKVVMEAIIEVCAYRGWMLLAAHVRTNHVHAVVQADARAEKVMSDFKAYASRRLNKDGFDSRDRKRWARHGSTRYKWTWDEVERAVVYVLREQGDQMETYDLSEARA